MTDGARLEGVRAVVTGASRGLGRAVAEAFADAGARVVVTARSERALESVLAAATGRRELIPVALELGDADSIAAAAAHAVRALGRVDVLVNSAGVLGARGALVDADLDDVAHTVAVDALGPLRLTAALRAHLAPGAAVVNVGSGAAGRPGWGGYGVAKAALDGITAMLRAELGPEGIRVVGVNPGGMRTTMRAAAYPAEDPATVPHPRALVGVFLAIADGADPGAHVEARQWTD